MDISALSGNGSSSGLTSGTFSSQIQGEEFFNLLLTEMKNQDPFEPMDHSQMLSQLAQFSALEQSETTNLAMQNMNLMMQEMVTLQRLSEGWGLIGYEIEYVDGDTGETQSGLVTSVTHSEGQIVAEIDGTQVPLEWITRISSPSNEESSQE